MTTTSTTVDARRLLEWVADECRRRGVDLETLCEAAAAGGAGWAPATIARRLRRAATQGTVDVDAADRILTALDGNLGELDVQEPVEWCEGWCPRCRSTVLAAADGGCSWCGTQTGAGTRPPLAGRRSNAGIPVLMTDDVLLDARRLYATGASMRTVAERLFERTGYATVASLTSSLFIAFARRGWATRRQGDVTAARNHRHGRGARGRDERAYRRWLSEQRRVQCEAERARGGRCTRPAIAGERYCTSHHPTRAAEREARLAAVRERWARDFERCRGTVQHRARKGQPCLRRAVPGTGYCPAHHPTTRTAQED